MSMYNMIFGKNPFSKYLLEILDMTEAMVPRFRDCYFTESNQICIYTRTGGGNREYYDALDIHIANCDYEDCDHKMPYNEDMRKHKWFSRDEDDDFDETYAYFYFTPPDSVVEILKDIKDIGGADDASGKWDRLLKKMDGKNNDGEMDEVLEKMKPLMETIKGFVDGSDNPGTSSNAESTPTK